MKYSCSPFRRRTLFLKKCSVPRREGVDLDRMVVDGFLMIHHSLDPCSDMWNHRIREFVESSPFTDIVHIRFKVLRHTLPSISEVEVYSLFPIDIVSDDFDTLEDLFSMYTNAYFL